MEDEEISPEFAAALPEGIDPDECRLTTFGDLQADGHEINPGMVFEDPPDDTPVLIVPGWTADDGNAEVAFPEAVNGEEAAVKYVRGGDWDIPEETDWIRVHAWMQGYAWDAEHGDVVVLHIDTDEHTVALDPPEPDCVDDNGHDWQSPHSVVGGLEENPGVYGHGGGVFITQVCANCGMYRIEDTWAQDRETGEEGLRSVRYEEADTQSQEWVESRNVPSV